MQTINLSSLKRNAAEALRRSQEDLLVVLDRGRPDAVLLGLASTGLLELTGVRPALATALFREGQLSLARSARLAQMPLREFIAHLARVGLSVEQMNEAETERDLETLARWLAPS